MRIRWKLKDIAQPERWSARKLSEVTGLAYNTVWGIWTNKTRRADLDTLATLASVLNVQPGDLLEVVPEERPNEDRKTRYAGSVALAAA